MACSQATGMLYGRKHSALAWLACMGDGMASVWPCSVAWLWQTAAWCDRHFGAKQDRASSSGMAGWHAGMADRQAGMAWQWQAVLLYLLIKHEKHGGMHSLVNNNNKLSWQLARKLAAGASSSSQCCDSFHQTSVRGRLALQQACAWHAQSALWHCVFLVALPSSNWHGSVCLSVCHVCMLPFSLTSTRTAE